MSQSCLKICWFDRSNGQNLRDHPVRLWHITLPPRQVTAFGSIPIGKGEAAALESQMRLGPSASCGCAGRERCKKEPWKPVTAKLIPNWPTSLAALTASLFTLLCFSLPQQLPI